MLIETKNESPAARKPSSNHDAVGDSPLSAPHAFAGIEIANLLGVEIEKGLSNVEAQNRLTRDGANVLETAGRRSLWRILLAQFSSIVIWLLAFAAIVAWFTDSRLEAAAILIVLIINAVIGFAIEWQAQRSLNALKKVTHSSARIRRGNHETIVDAAELVRGDIVILTAGDRVPADARLIEAVNLQVDESALTGESVPAEKSILPVDIFAALAERRSMIYLGTNAVRGRAVAIITATGVRTEIGHIGQLIDQTVSEHTPLEKKLQELGKKLVYIVMAVAAAVMIAGLWRGDEWWLMFEVAVSLAVAAVPEGLPAVTTLILALGVLRMARRKAIVRKLSAVETLGSTTVICTDKTGTLTENRMTVREYQLSDGRTIQLSGYDKNTAPDEHLRKLLRVGILCSEASLETNTDANNTLGDPTEIALLIAAEKLNTGVSAERAAYGKIFEIPFDSVTKRMIVVFKGVDGQQFAALKGAPRVALDACRDYLSGDGKIIALDNVTRIKFLKINEAMADRALRVLGFAEKSVSGEFDSESTGADDYTFLGFAGMSDPPREGVSEAIRAARDGGIRVVMLTGDQLNTARAIASELYLNGDGEISALHSDDLINSDAVKLASLAQSVNVFARVSPEDKLRIVEALQQAGEIVAVTGDGVNDAPALKRADIGIAMGLRGTEVAKEAADIVLTDDNFSTLVKAVEGGRAIYANIIKFVQMMFSHNLAEIIVIFIPIAAGLPLPLLPLQILWINLVTDIFPALALAVEPPSPDVMNRRPLAAHENLLSAPFLFLISWQGAMLAAITLAAYFWALQNYGAGAHAQTVVLFSIVGVQLGHLYNCRSRTRSAFVGFFSNPYIFVATFVVIGLQLLAVYFAPLAQILDTVPPKGADFIVIAVSVLLPILIVESVKIYGRRKTFGWEL